MQTWNKEIRVEPIASRTPSGSRHTAIENTFVIQGLIQDAIFAYCKDQRYRLESVRCKESTDQTRLTAVSYFSLKLVEQHEGVTLKNKKRATSASVFENNFHRGSLPSPSSLFFAPLAISRHFPLSERRKQARFLLSKFKQSLDITSCTFQR